MPLTQENRLLLEIAIISYLKRTEEATSKDIYYHLNKRGFLAVKSPKQVSMICLGFEKRGVLFSRTIEERDKLRIYKKKSWRINPKFHEEHPRQSMFSFRISASEFRRIKKGRMKA